ncbi:MAG: hypothetical protein E7Z87_08125 [Cyanobacteria bacterium SIG26]|nr:hypothetical protein [Cyanobacteria bacterium SIG26]
MNMGTWIALIGLFLTVIAYIVTIVIFLTRQSDNLKYIEKAFAESKKSVLESVKEYKETITVEFEKFKSDLNEKIRNNQEHTKEHIIRLEQKQDKHNNLIERMAIVEQSTKSAHHRSDDFKVRIEELERINHDK